MLTFFWLPSGIRTRRYFGATLLLPFVELRAREQQQHMFPCTLIRMISVTPWDLLFSRDNEVDEALTGHVLREPSGIRLVGVFEKRQALFCTQPDLSLAPFQSRSSMEHSRQARCSLDTDTCSGIVSNHGRSSQSNHCCQFL